MKLFGSRARGDHRAASDIDLAVAGKGGIRERLAHAFDESALPYTFDIVDYENLSNAHLRHAVDTDGVLLWKKEDGAAWNEKRSFCSAAVHVAIAGSEAILTLP